MLHNKSLKIYFFVSYYNDGWRFIVSGFFFVQNLGFFVTKIGVERLRGLNFVTLFFIYLYLPSLYFLFLTFPTRTSRGRGMTYLSPLN